MSCLDGRFELAYRYDRHGGHLLLDSHLLPAMLLWILLHRTLQTLVATLLDVIAFVTGERRAQLQSSSEHALISIG